MTNFPIRKLAALGALGGLLLASCAELTDLPRLSRADLEFRPAESSRIFATDGRLITTMHGVENRTVIPSLRAIPKVVRRAVVAIEDERFYKHDGVDLKAVLRAALANVRSGTIQEGGSTITQQYIKNVIISPGEIAARTFERKIQEAALARQLEAALPKREILRRYLNTVYFGSGAYGIQAAAKAYFGIPAARLGLAQAALLAALVRSPETYDPFDRPRAARARRNLVLSKMAELEWAAPERVAKAQGQGLRLRPGRQSKSYPAAYFVDYVQRLITFDPRFEDLGKTWKKRQQELFTGGLRIYTTVDLEEQRAAEQAVKSVLTEPQDPYASLVSIDPQNGHVKAMVGGRNFFARKRKNRFSKLNLAIQGEPHLGRVRDCGAAKLQHRAPGCGRQAGSAFKPFALAAALEKGTPLSKTYKAPACITFPTADNGGPWRPCNYEQAPYGNMSLLDATVFSVNVVYAQLAQEVGEQAVVDMAKEMGIRTPLSPVASAVLGTNTVNPLGMASAYGSLAANGTHHPPVAITKITNSAGKVLYRDKTKGKEVLNPAHAYITSSALTQVIQRGTAAAYGQIARPAAGKTGTAQDYHDAWFVGYTPDRVASVWVGYPSGPIAMLPACSALRNAQGEEICRPTRIQVSGGTWPTLIWANFMQRALARTPASSFPVPDNLVTVIIDTRTGCLVNDFTPADKRATASFEAGTAPTETCFVPGDSQKVPDLRSFPLRQAVRVLESQGFAISTVKEATFKYPPDRVIDQRPAPGVRVATGTTVTIVVSAPGERAAVVPQVLGLGREDAEEELEELGFEVRSIVEPESDSKEVKKNKGRVWKQNPASGTKTEKGSTVTIYVNPG
jgi:membrane peptidoglycan carboxypeptidase